MAKKDKNTVNIKKYQNRRGFNIGIFLFSVVFIYLIAAIVLYATDEEISVYEVREGSIVQDASYTGLIIREETVVKARAAGYVTYYQADSTKLKKGSAVYALTDTELDLDSGTADTASAELNEDVRESIVYQIQQFNQNYNADDFSAIYTLKEEIQTYLLDAYNSSRTEQIEALLSESSIDADTYSTAQDGIIALSTDGMESLSLENFTAEDFEKTDYSSVSFSDGMQVSAGDAVYRMVTGEEWYILVELDADTAEELIADETSTMEIRIDKDNEKAEAVFDVLQSDGNYYGCLTLNDSMVRYAGERYLSVELIFSDETGLKIPRTAAVEEEFYVVPEEYATTGGNSSSTGVLVEDAESGAVFQAVDIYETLDGEIYIRRDALSEGTVLLKPDSSETYTVGETKTLLGVYNINRGYAVFKKITVISENEEYYIVEEGEDYGLSNYDHIVQNGDSVEADEVVFQ